MPQPNTACTRSPAKYAGATLAPHASAGVVVGVGAFSGTLRGLKLVPAKRRSLSPRTSTPEGA
jgi:hypothetical protein